MTTFYPALFFISLALFAVGFHSAGSLLSPQDIAPKHSGSIFGIMNAAGAIPGTKLVRPFSGRTTEFQYALFLMAVAIFANGFHKLGTVVNTMDLAPKHSGSVFGLINTTASLSGPIAVCYSNMMTCMRLPILAYC